MPLPAKSLKIVIFDVDGTLYRQGPLRRTMLLRLLRHTASRPVDGLRTVRLLRAYRHAQEALRGTIDPDIAAAQMRLACNRTNTDAAVAAASVERWMEREPLPYLAQCIQPGLIDFLDACTRRGVRLAALSDYPADAKLHALGIADRFELALCAQAPEVGVFKPHPRGLHVAVERLGVEHHECLYIGDRVDVDAGAAAAAGIPCAILTRHPARAVDTHTVFTSYSQLQALLFGAGHGARRDVISAESYQ
jgi:FMN phosphatase YigB (HAD superfamily)